MENGIKSIQESKIGLIKEMKLKLFFCFSSKAEERDGGIGEKEAVGPAGLNKHGLSSAAREPCTPPQEHQDKPILIMV